MFISVDVHVHGGVGQCARVTDPNTTIVTHNTPLYKHIPINHISTSTTTLVNILILTY